MRQNMSEVYCRAPHILIHVNYCYSASEVKQYLFTALVMTWLECGTHGMASRGPKCRLCPQKRGDPAMETVFPTY